MRNSTKRLNSLKSEIEDVTKTLTKLTIELDQIIKEDNDSEKDDDNEIPQAKLVRKQSKESVTKDNSKINLGPPFKVGERVVITNNYKGLKGTEGVVTGHSFRKKYTYIVDDTGKSHHKEGHNLKRVTASF